jgi:adenylate cyclase
VLERHNRLLRPAFAEFHGREVKTIGDAFLVEFGSALEAVQCAVRIQSALHEFNAASPDAWRIRVRIGIHVGDVVPAEGDVLGDAVNIASRIEPLAEPEGICLTQQVFDQVQHKVTAPLVRLPAVALKNIRLPVPVYRVVPPWEAPRRAGPAVEPASERRVAVLPLSNISPDPGDGYFADGLTEELISALSQIRGLGVIARTSVMPYKTAPKPIPEVGADLGVDTVLEGSVRKAGNRIRITLQLIDVASQRHIWATSYNREVDDVFAVQTDVAERTAEALRLQFAGSEATAGRRKPTSSPEAYEAYLRGLVASRARSGPEVDEAVRQFERATRLDPSFAEAYAAWGNLYVVAAGDSLPMREVMPKARELAARALALDPQSSEAHATLGNIALQFDADWVLAESEFRRAIELNPSNVTAHRFYGLLLVSQERFEEAKEVLGRVVVLDPESGPLGSLAWAELEAGNFDVALSYAEKERDADPTSVGAHNMLGLFYLEAGRLSDALHEADTPVEGANPDERFDRALLNACVGRPEAARAVAAEVERGEARSYTSATHLAMLYGALGEKGRALDLLEQEFREGDRVLWLSYRGVFFDSLRDEPRFLELLRRNGLPTHGIRGHGPPRT